MDDLRWRDLLRPLARDLMPVDRERKDAAIRSAFDATGTLLPGALSASLPPLVFAWWLPGTLAAATNASAEIELPGDARLVRLLARAKTAPASDCAIRLTADGAEVAVATLPAGYTRGATPIESSRGRQRAGSVLRVDIVAAGGAKDMTVIVAYTSAE